MDRHILAGLNAEVSALGFGAASLGSRVSAREGQRLVAQALAAGVTWFDLAPAYGAGQAEEIFAAAIKGQRDKVQICTKVGLAPPPQSLWKRAIMPVARQVVRSIAPLRGRIRKSGLTSNRPLPLTPDLLRTSLERSLQRLGTDHLDLYALHNASPEALRDDALLRTLEDLRTSGKVRAIAVASGGGSAEAALAQAQTVGVLQCALQDATSDLITRAAQARMGVITHSVFGVQDASDIIAQRIAASQELQVRHVDAGAPSPAILRLMTARLRNPTGVTLCSMMSSAHIAANTAVFALPLSSETADLARLLNDDPTPQATARTSG